MREGKGRWLGFAVLGAIPCILAVAELGRLHPDEVFQVLEPAYFRAHGYGILAWEWRQGVRNWAFPGLLAGILKLCDFVGITHPVAYRAALAIPQWALHTLALAAVHRYLCRRVSLQLAGAGLMLFALNGWVLAFAGRTLGEAISADFLVLAFDALDECDWGTGSKKSRAAIGAGLWLGLAVVARYGSLIFTAVALSSLLIQRSFRTLGWVILSGASVALALGILDWVTWGQPFHSLLEYFQFNVSSGQAAVRYGTEGGAFYLAKLAYYLTPWAWFGLPVAFLPSRRRPWLLVLGVATYVTAISWVPHKEDRFLYPALVLLMLAALPGVLQGVTQIHSALKRVVMVAVGLAVGLLAWRFRADPRGDEIRAIVASTRDEEARGLLIVGEGLWGSGGYFYIGKNIPWRVCDFAQSPEFKYAAADPRFNRAVTFQESQISALLDAGFRIDRRIGRETLLRR